MRAEEYLDEHALASSETERWGVVLRFVAGGITQEKFERRIEERIGDRERGAGNDGGLLRQ